MTFPDVADELITALERDFDGLTADTVTGDVGARLPLAVVSDLGGPADELTQYARINIDVFAPTRSASYSLAAQIHDWLVPRRRLVSVTIDTVRTDARPHEVPWSGDTVRRHVATYQLSTRR
jgi:hypothetical protein